MVVEYETDLYDGQDSLITVGTYHFGKHILALDPPEEDRLGLYCAFDGFNMDRCEGYIAHEASTEICAEIVFVRKHGTILRHVFVFVVVSKKIKQSTCIAPCMVYKPF